MNPLKYHCLSATQNVRHHRVAEVDFEFRKHLATATPVHGIVLSRRALLTSIPSPVSVCIMESRGDVSISERSGSKSMR